jgi:hypothetical protein
MGVVGLAVTATNYSGYGSADRLTFFDHTAFPTKVKDTNPEELPLPHKTLEVK